MQTPADSPALSAALRFDRSISDRSPAPLVGTRGDGMERALGELRTLLSDTRYASLVAA